MSNKKKKLSTQRDTKPAPVPLPPESRSAFFAGLCAALAIACVVFVLRFDWRIIDPFNVEWLLHLRYGDTISQFLVWRFFRYETWQLPLGTITGYLYPLGTTIGYSDCIPAMALSAKAAAPFITAEFQYFGLWRLLCYLLQGVFAFLLMRTVTRKIVLLALGTAFFAISPVLLMRDHFALNAQWMLLASLWFYFARFDRSRLRFVLAAVVALTALTPLVHPYLVAMVTGLSLLYGLRLYFIDKSISLKQCALYITALIGSLLLVASLLGFISKDEQMGSWGFGYYSMNLNAPFNPRGAHNSPYTSSLFKELPCNEGQYEGYSYFGIGFLLLLAYALWLKKFANAPLSDEGKSFHPLQQRLFPLVLLSIGYTAFALTNQIYWGKTLVFQYELSESLMKLASLFRCSGRFFWVPYYLIIYLVLRTAIHRTQSFKRGVVILSLCLGVQVYDIFPLITNKDVTCTWFTFNEQVWNNALEGFERISVFPPYTKDIRRGDDYMEFLYLAAPRKMKVNTGYMLRPQKVDMTYVNRVAYELYSGQADKDALYIVTDEYVAKFAQPLNTYFHCYLIENYLACYTKQRPPRTALAPYRVTLKVENGKIVYNKV